MTVNVSSTVSCPGPGGGLERAARALPLLEVMLAPSSCQIEHLVRLLEVERPAVAAHSHRVALLASRFAAQYGLDAGTVDEVRVGGLLHDIGKLLIDDRILQKTTRLNRREWQELSLHPEVGGELARRAGATVASCEIVLFHHERFDGTGYPDRLAGSAIPWLVRIVSVIDAFDVLTHPGPHRSPLGVDAARTFIARQAGTQFCPWVVSGLLSIPSWFLQVGQNGPAPAAGIPDSIVAGAVDQSAESFAPLVG